MKGIKSIKLIDFLYAHVPNPDILLESQRPDARSEIIKAAALKAQKAGSPKARKGAKKGAKGGSAAMQDAMDASALVCMLGARSSQCS